MCIVLGSWVCTIIMAPESVRPEMCNRKGHLESEFTFVGLLDLQCNFVPPSARSNTNIQSRAGNLHVSLSRVTISYIGKWTYGDQHESCEYNIHIIDCTIICFGDRCEVQFYRHHTCYEFWRVEPISIMCELISWLENKWWMWFRE